ncbi:MAG: helix-turn-helix domain-containing protein [Gemmatimonadaceae bacterium]
MAATTTPRFNHVKCAPSAALARFVEYYWVSRWDRRGQPTRNAASLLDPCVHLLIENGRAEIMGVVRGSYRVRLEGAGNIVGAKFTSTGFHAFAQRPVREWTDRTAPAGEVFGGDDSWVRELSNAVLACDGDANAHAAIIAEHFDAVLLARLPERDPIADEVRELVTLIASSGDVRRMSDLVRASGRSERTLDRLFARYVGVSPVWVIRRYRLQSAAARLTAMPPADVRDVAWELGYADQAHFIRDFRATIGVTPGAYVSGGITG